MQSTKRQPHAAIWLNLLAPVGPKAKDEAIEGQPMLRQSPQRIDMHKDYPPFYDHFSIIYILSSGNNVELFIGTVFVPSRVDQRDSSSDSAAPA